MPPTRRRQRTANPATAGVLIAMIAMALLLASSPRARAESPHVPHPRHDHAASFKKMLKTAKGGHAREAPAGESAGLMAAAGATALGPDRCGTSSATPVARERSQHFVVDFVHQPRGGLTRADYVQALERSWQKVIDEFGWAAPPTVAGDGFGGRYYVRVDKLPHGTYGWLDTRGNHAGLVGDNPNTPWQETYAYASCIMLTHDFSSGRPVPVSAVMPYLTTVAAHELTHAIQYGYDVLTNGVRTENWDSVFLFMEATATWMEDEVFPDANRGAGFLPPALSDSLVPHFVSNDVEQGDEYAMWLAFRAVTERYGSGNAGGAEDVVQDMWELQGGRDGGAYGADALDRAVADKAQTTLGRSWNDFGVAAWFLHRCEAGWRRPYCFTDADLYDDRMRRYSAHGRVASAGSSYAGTVEDNLAIHWVKLPDRAPRRMLKVSLRNVSERGDLRVAVACDGLRGLSLRSGGSGVAGPGQTLHVAPLDLSACRTGTPVAVVSSSSRTGSAPSLDSRIDFELETQDVGPHLAPHARQRGSSGPTMRSALSPSPSRSRSSLAAGLRPVNSRTRSSR